ncbi:hypothetical protein [Photorhabdus aegyptia]|nr:hypothetical protein [Photorhabdus aegyptia]
MECFTLTKPELPIAKCKDGKQKDGYEHTRFDFLGYTLSAEA